MQKSTRILGFGSVRSLSLTVVTGVLFIVLIGSAARMVSSQQPDMLGDGDWMGDAMEAEIPGNSQDSQAKPAPGAVVGTAQGMQNVLAQTAARPFQVGAAGDMIGFSHSDGTGSQTITLINTRKSWMAVYHIDRSGTIQLTSSRPIDDDFTLLLNATSPLPEEIRRMNGKGK
ncbi:hypothetical protein Q31b_38580 [Novipirellula aureliae]|uniref:Uncharacterized protein n=1 Tax=Novipirellula aureliae TaxID=2527966 RepID=A0A5C6DPN3_9BACT|nr:hypothetical protein [Novipirellula aureliae]TWU38780.1 hypothetical protein Q31b_38580 [Novipirellula aureliae]